jgi:hypothetical protein
MFAAENIFRAHRTRIPTSLLQVRARRLSLSEMEAQYAEVVDELTEKQKKEWLAAIEKERKRLEDEAKKKAQDRLNSMTAAEEKQKNTVIGELSRRLSATSTTDARQKVDDDSAPRQQASQTEKPQS